MVSDHVGHKLKSPQLNNQKCIFHSEINTFGWCEPNQKIVKRKLFFKVLYENE